MDYTKSTGIRVPAKYWRMAEAVMALDGASAAEVEEWVRLHYPHDPIGNVRADLEHLTVNAPSRVHYDTVRTNWRSDSGHPRDRLFKVAEVGGRKRYVLFDPAVHGHVNLVKNLKGRWEVVRLVLDRQAQAEVEGQALAFSQRPPLTSDQDARVWTMQAVAQRRGQSLFRAKLLDAYDRTCTITGCSAVEVLEAAHVLPYRGDHTDRLDNGLLLRSDVHTLFDCLLLWITDKHTVDIAPTLATTEYAKLRGKLVRLPQHPGDRPNPSHLAEHAARCKAHIGARGA